MPRAMGISRTLIAAALSTLVVGGALGAYVLVSLSTPRSTYVSSSATSTTPTSASSSSSTTSTTPSSTSTTQSSSVPSVPSVRTDKTAYAQGETIHFTGSGFTHGGSVLSWLAGFGVTQPNSNSNGTAIGTMQVGTNVPPGPRVFYLEDVATGVNSNLVQLTITATPLFLDSSEDIAGTTITLAGSGYTPGAQYYYCFSPTNTPCTSSSFIAIAPGAIPQGTTVQASGLPGTYYVTVSSGGVVLASQTFKVGVYTLVYQGTYFDWYAFQDTWNREFANNPNLASMESYPDQAYVQVNNILGVDVLARIKAHSGNSLCPGQRLCLEVGQSPGAGGAASGSLAGIDMGPGIYIAHESWTTQYYPGDVVPTDYYSTELIPHETSNVFIGEIIAPAIPPPPAANWPSLWWTDDKSPFSYTMKVLVEMNTGHSAAANWDLACPGATFQPGLQECADPLVKMFYGFYNTYPHIFSNMMSDIINDGWSSGWPSPADSRLNSEYVAAYLSLAAGTNLTSQLNNGFTQENSFFGQTIIPYSLDSGAVATIWSYRNWLQNFPRTDSRWLLFYQGGY